MCRMDFGIHINFPYNTDTDDSENGYYNMDFNVPPNVNVSEVPGRSSLLTDHDFFLNKLRTYHLKHGFFYILLGAFIKLLLEQIVVLILCIIVFKNGPLKCSGSTTGDLCLFFDKYFILIWTGIIIIFLHMSFSFIKHVHDLYHFWCIKSFYNIELQIPDSKLKMVTWREVKERIRDVQLQQKVYIWEEELTALGIWRWTLGLLPCP